MSGGLSYNVNGGGLSENLGLGLYGMPGESFSGTLGYGWSFSKNGTQGGFNVNVNASGYARDHFGSGWNSLQDAYDKFTNGFMGNWARTPNGGETIPPRKRPWATRRRRSDRPATGAIHCTTRGKDVLVCARGVLGACGETGMVGVWHPAGRAGLLYLWLFGHRIVAMAKNRSARLRVLFIGNSFTQRNDLPGMLAGMAEAAGAELEWRLVSVGGASLRTHWNKGEAARAIAEGKYDYVVLQEQSTLPIKNRARMHENVRLFDAAIKAAGSKTALYLTWARKDVSQKQAEITNAYESIGKELNATVVPAGVAWQRFLERHDKPALHDVDGSHPTVAGTYLAACVFLQALFGRSPAGNDAAIDGHADEDRMLLQRAAVA